MALFKRAGWAKRRGIATLRDLDNDRVSAALPRVILRQPATKASGFAAYSRILSWVKSRLSPEYLNSDDRFLEVGIAALKMTLHHHPQKPGQALIAREPLAREYALQFSPHGFG